MKFLKDEGQKAYDKARKRLSRVSRVATVDWANLSLWSIQEALEHADDPAALEQARTGAIGLLAAVDDLLDKTR